VLHQYGRPCLEACLAALQLGSVSHTWAHLPQQEWPGSAATLCQQLPAAMVDVDGGGGGGTGQGPTPGSPTLRESPDVGPRYPFKHINSASHRSDCKAAIHGRLPACMLTSDGCAGAARAFVCVWGGAAGAPSGLLAYSRGKKSGGWAGAAAAARTCVGWPCGGRVVMGTCIECQWSKCVTCGTGCTSLLDHVMLCHGLTSLVCVLAHSKCCTAGLDPRRALAWADCVMHAMHRMHLNGCTAAGAGRGGCS
jgi:hypothetical protein